MFIGFLDHENILFDTKIMFLPKLEIKILTFIGFMAAILENGLCITMLKADRGSAIILLKVTNILVQRKKYRPFCKVQPTNNPYSAGLSNVIKQINAQI